MRNRPAAASNFIKGHVMHRSRVPVTVGIFLIVVAIVTVAWVWRTGNYVWGVWMGYWISTAVLVSVVTYSVSMSLKREKWFPLAATLLMVIYSILYFSLKLPLEIPETILGLGFLITATIAFWREGNRWWTILGLALTGCLAVFLLLLHGRR